MKRIAIITALLFSFNLLLAESYHWNKGRGYTPFKYATEEGVLIDNKTDSLLSDYYSLSNPTKDFNLTFRARNFHGIPDKKYRYKSGNRDQVITDPYWGFFMTYGNDTIAVNVKGAESKTVVESQREMEISAYVFSKGKWQRAGIKDGIDPNDGENIWKIKAKEGKLTISCGNHSQKEVLRLQSGNTLNGFGFYAGWGDKVMISDIILHTDDINNEANRAQIYVYAVPEGLAESEDEMEGYWTMFDRELEESLLKPGGNYNLVCLKDSELYKFYYLDGAETNSSNWNPGDLKIVLSPTPFEGIYEVEWIDAMKKSMKKDIKAQTGEGNTLIIQFPYQSSRLRLRKIPD